VYGEKAVFSDLYGGIFHCLYVDAVDFYSQGKISAAVL
jgi:hypothetical protein